MSKMNAQDNNQSRPLFYGLMNSGGYFMRQNIVTTDTNLVMHNMRPNWSTTTTDDDQALLWLKMAAQQDAASLAEETKFVNLLIKKPN